VFDPSITVFTPAITATIYVCGRTDVLVY